MPWSGTPAAAWRVGSWRRWPPMWNGICSAWPVAPSIRSPACRANRSCCAGGTTEPCRSQRSSRRRPCIWLWPLLQHRETQTPSCRRCKTTHAARQRQTWIPRRLRPCGQPWPPLPLKPNKERWPCVAARPRASGGRWIAVSRPMTTWLRCCQPLHAPALARAVQGLKAGGALGAKFSGAGGDGSVIALYQDPHAAREGQAWMGGLEGVQAWICRIQRRPGAHAAAAG
ncbi:hypothetical protein [Synechococcus sp. CBW1006]|uniref:hypothetical protein n=1 Tax=unclassified Synechococcus TaxID=2626047 RepID=UPI00351C171D